VAEFTPADAAAVAAMFNNSEEGWPGGFTGGVPMTAEHVLRQQREAQPLATFIAWEGDMAAGYCSLFDYPGERGVAGYVGLLNVATAFQGRGHGRDLLKAALQHCISLGYGRLDLHTWPGNMKAVPLYKKSGYVWVPESEVHMENYLPLLLGLPVLADFWAEADWYRAQVRDLSVKEDLYLTGKMRVYPYEFRHGERYVRATIDATAKGLTALETERWRVSCTVDDRRLVVGRPRTVRWEVENRTGRPLSLTLLAGAGAGLRLAREETVVVVDCHAAEAALSAEPDYQPPVFGQRAPRVESLLLLDGLPIRLETGVEIKPPFEVRFEPRRVSLAPGRPRDVILQVHNNMAEAAAAHLALAPSPGLTVWPTESEQPSDASPSLDLTVEGESYTGTVLRASAAVAGAHVLEVRTTATANGETFAMAPLHLLLPAAGSGELVALTADGVDDEETEEDVRDREVRIEGPTYRLVVRLRQGRYHLEDALTGAHLAGGLVLVGPPFTWFAQSHVCHEATIERHDGALAVILRGRLPHLPDAMVEHELRLAPDGLLRLETALANAGHEDRQFQGAVWVWNNRGELPTIVLPTVHGLVASADVEFPDWGDLELQDPAVFSEGWIACQGDGRVVGLLWSEVSRVEADRWRFQVVQDPDRLRPGERRVLSPLYVYAGPGDWRTVRGRWRGLVRPDVQQHDPPTREVVELAAAPVPAALLAGASPNKVTLSNLANREAAGRLAIEAPDGWEISPAVHEVSGLRVRRPHEVEVAVRNMKRGPRAAAVKAFLRTERTAQVVFEGAVLDPGDTAGAVATRDETREAQRVLVVDNGYLRFRLAPAFLGSVIALETVADGVNHLLSAFPTPREFAWWRPWYGGLHAVIYSPGLGVFPGPTRLYEETFWAQEATQTGHDGRIWRGLTVRSMLRGKGLRGLELAATYLTLPGSNLLAARVAVCNHTAATLPVHAALVAYLQPGGTVDGAELLLDVAGRRRLLRGQRSEQVSADGWLGVRNSRSGQTLALVCGAHEAGARVIGVDCGALGAHVGARVTLRLGPGEEKGALSFLALARDEDEARAYRVLAGTQELP
jgi:ribosomal protein S18 acetylase RimI-like enzyme